jgi:2-hydroxymuconate-semialdehyde hydrolase
MSNGQAYAEPIRAFIVEKFLEGHGEGLEVDSPMLELGIINSFSLAELVGWIETQWGIRIPDRELTPENLASIAALADLLGRLAEERQASTVHAGTGD